MRAALTSKGGPVDHGFHAQHGSHARAARINLRPLTLCRSCRRTTIDGAAAAACGWGLVLGRISRLAPLARNQAAASSVSMADIDGAQPCPLGPGDASRGLLRVLFFGQVLRGNPLGPPS